MRELEEAMRMMEDIIHIIPDVKALINLMTMLGWRFERTGSIADLNRAVDVVDMAVNSTP